MSYTEEYLKTFKRRMENNPGGTIPSGSKAASGNGGSGDFAADLYKALLTGSKNTPISDEERKASRKLDSMVKKWNRRQTVRKVNEEADAAEKAYNDFLHSEEYASVQDQKRLQRMFQQNGIPLKSGYDPTKEYAVSTKERELRQKAEQLRNLANQYKMEDVLSDVDNLAQKAEEEYQKYISSEGYTAWKMERDQAQKEREQLLVQAGIPMGLPAYLEEDKTERELAATAQYYRNLANQKHEQEMMAADMKELESWPEEDRRELMLYVADRNRDATGPVELMGLPGYRNASQNAERLIGKYGAQKVNEIAESYMRSQNEQAAEEISAAARESAGSGFWYGVGHSIESTGANLIGSAISPLGYLVEAGQRTGRYSTLDPNNPGMLPGTYAGAVRGAVSEKIADSPFGSTGATLYQAGMSALDNLTRIIMAGGTGSLALAATGSFGQAVSEYSRQGAQPLEAVGMGIISGGLEVLTEKVSLDRLLKDAGEGSKHFLEILKDMLIQGGIEVSEEELSFLGSTLAEAAFLREKSPYNQQVAELQAYGISREEAKNRANWNMVEEAAETALQSFLSGSMMSGATSLYSNTVNRIQEKAEERQLKNTIRQAEQDIQQAGTGEGARVSAENGVVVNEEVRRQAERISKATGREIVFYSSDGTENGIENGYFQDGKIYVNIKSGNPVAQVISHELTHSVEMADAYKDLSKLVMNHISRKGTNLQQLRQQKAELYARKGITLQNQSEIDSEIVADYVAQHLLTDEQSILSLTTENPSLGKRILNWIDGLLAKLGNRNAQERAFLTQARSIYARALGQTRNATKAANTQVNNDHVPVNNDNVPVNNDNVPVNNKKAGQSNTNAQTDNAGMSMDQMKAWADEQYRRGEWSEEQYDAFLDSYQEYNEQNGIDIMEKENGRFAKEGEQPARQYSVQESTDQKKTYVHAKISAEDVEDGLQDVAEMKPVTKITGTEFEKGEINLVTQVTDFFAELGNRAYNPQLGIVKLDRQGAKSDLAHGIGRKKSASFAAIPDVLARGRVVDYQENWKGRGYDTAVVAAPILIGNEEHIMGIVLNRNLTENRFYVHEVMTTENGALPFKTGTRTNDPSGNTPSVLSILNKIKTVKQKAAEKQNGQKQFSISYEERDNTNNQVSDNEAEHQAKRQGYPVIKGKQIVPFKTWVLAQDAYKSKDGNPVLNDDGTVMRHHNYGLVTGMDGSGNLVVSFRNKHAQYLDGTDVRKDDVRIAYEDVTPVPGGSQMTDEEAESLMNSEPEDRQESSYTMDDLEEYNEMLRKEDAEKRKGQKKEHTPIDRESLNKKARDYLERAERKLLNKIGENLGIPYHAKRESLKPIVQEISNEYLRTGTVSDETVNSLFNKAYDEGIVADREFYDTYKGVKDHLRTTAVTISKQDQADIADFSDFRKRAFGTLRITTDGGLPVDTAYQELHDMAPNLFPETITHPANQLQRMFEVGQSIRVSEKSLDEYHGENAEEYRQWAKNDFASDVSDAIGELNRVKRYAEDRSAELQESKQITVDEAEELWANLKDARRKYEKVNAKSILTREDEMQVGRLLRGEILPEHVTGENANQILAVYEAKQEYESINELLTRYKKQIKAQRLQQADGFLETAITWIDKRTGIAYSRETMRRNIFDIVPDQALAERIAEEYFEPVHVSEAQATRFKTEYRDRVRELGLSTKVQKGNLVSEAHAVQLLGEATDNIKILEASQGRMKTRDGMNLSEWRAVVDNLWMENQGLDKGKIENAVEKFRRIYNELFQKMNRVRIENGYEPVNYRHGYFPHFQPGDGDGIIAYFGRSLGIDTNVDALPTTINGLTHTFKPGIQWFGNAQERLGFNTAYDAVEGFDKYIEGVASVIFQTENIQKLRALASQARYRTSDEGLQMQVDATRQDSRLTDEEKQMKIQEIYEKGKFTLSNFVAELDEYTNLLANKKSKYDRTMESLIGRRGYTIMKNVESKVAANMIGGNISSALTNFIPLTQAWGRIGSADLLRGMRDTARAVIHKDASIVGQSDFLTNRRGSDVLVQRWNEKLSSVLGTPMEMIDNVVSESIVRAKYYQNLRRGMSETEAMHQADIFAAGVMADRSKGSMPTLFESSNPLFKAFTQFQLEVNNQYSEIFKDIPREYKGKAKWMLAAAFFKYFVAAWLFNNLEEKIKGRRSAMDPIGIATDFAEDWKKKGFGEAGKNLAVNVAEELPFASALSMVGIDIDGGRVPVASAMPDFAGLWDAATDPDMNKAQRWKTVKDEIQKPITYLLLPGGGNQAQKMWKGIDAYLKGGSYGLDRDGDPILQYPVFKDDNGDAFWNLVKATLFGKNSLETAQDWVNGDFNSLNKFQTVVYQDMLEAKVPDRDAFTLIDRLRNVPKPDGEGGEEIRRRNQQEILLGADISDEGKAIAFYGMVASGSEKEFMNKLTDAGADPGSVIKFVIDFKDADALRGAERREALRETIVSSSLTEEEKTVAVGEILGTKMEYDNGNPTQYAKFLTARNEGISVDQYMDLYSKDVNVDNYLKLVDSGVSSDGAVEIAIALNDLEPEDGKEDVSWMQKCNAILDMKISDAERVAALESVSYESTGQKIRIGYENGLAPETFVNLKRILPDYDANGNGSYSQKEVTAAIDAMAGSEIADALFGGSSTLSNTQKAILWQLQTNAKDGKSNPYDREVGKYIYDLVKERKEAADQEKENKEDKVDTAKEKPAEKKVEPETDIMKLLTGIG